jgi:hypothetical protein
MFVRFRQRGARLHVTLVANRREAGRVRQRHVASLGVLRPTGIMAAWVSPYERGRIWQNLFKAADELSLDIGVIARFAAAIEAQAPFPGEGEAAEFLTTLSLANDLVMRWPEICKRHLALEPAGPLWANAPTFARTGRAQTGGKSCSRCAGANFGR